MAAKELFYDGTAACSAYFDNRITHDVRSEEALDIYYDNLIAYNLQKKMHLDARIGIKAARKRIVRIVFIAVLVSVLMTITIDLKSEIINRENRIDVLTTQVEQLSRENTDRKKRLTDNTNILTIKQKAMDLGMNYAGKDAVVYYSVGKDDYMRMYNN